MEEQMKFIVKFYPTKTSFNGILFSYLNQFKTTTFEKKEKVYGTPEEHQGIHAHFG